MVWLHVSLVQLVISAGKKKNVAVQWGAVERSGVEWMKGKQSEDKEMEYDREQKGRT